MRKSGKTRKSDRSRAKVLQSAPGGSSAGSQRISCIPRSKRRDRAASQTRRKNFGAGELGYRSHSELIIDLTAKTGGLWNIPEFAKKPTIRFRFFPICDQPKIVPFFARSFSNLTFHTAITQALGLARPYDRAEAHVIICTPAQTIIHSRSCPTAGRLHVSCANVDAIGISLKTFTETHSTETHSIA